MITYIIKITNFGEVSYHTDTLLESQQIGLKNDRFILNDLNVVEFGFKNSNILIVPDMITFN